MISERLLSLVKHFEGCRLKAYKDIVGIITIGWGYTGDSIKLGMTWTQEQADKALVDELEKVRAKVLGLTQGKCSDNQVDALACFAYNVGIGALGSSTLLKKALAGDEAGAAAQFLRWNKAGGKEVAGLTARRQAERELFLCE